MPRGGFFADFRRSQPHKFRDIRPGVDFLGIGDVVHVLNEITHAVSVNGPTELNLSLHLVPLGYGDFLILSPNRATLSWRLSEKATATRIISPIRRRT